MDKTRVEMNHRTPCSPKERRGGREDSLFNHYFVSMKVTKVTKIENEGGKQGKPFMKRVRNIVVFCRMTTFVSVNNSFVKIGGLARFTRTVSHDQHLIKDQETKAGFPISVLVLFPNLAFFLSAIYVFHFLWPTLIPHQIGFSQF